MGGAKQDEAEEQLSNETSRKKERYFKPHPNYADPASKIRHSSSLDGTLLVTKDGKKTEAHLNTATTRADGHTLTKDEAFQAFKVEINMAAEHLFETLSKPKRGESLRQAIRRWNKALEDYADAIIKQLDQM